jgi:hypothetical protein
MTRSERRVYRLAGAIFGGVALAGSLAALDVASGADRVAAGRWSAPARVGACASLAAPIIAFPSAGPRTRTGPGALAWAQGAGCPGGPGLRLAALDGADTAAAAQDVADTPGERPGASVLTGARAGRLLLAGSGLLREGTAGGRFEDGRAISGVHGPVALATAYRGQPVALSAPADGEAGALLLRRPPSTGLHGERAQVVDTLTAPVGALTVALDYRTDAIAVWAQRGYLYARALPRSAPAAAVQRLGRCGPDPQPAALISDDDHAIVAWTYGDHGETRVYATISRRGIRFQAPTLLERYRDPSGVPPPSGSLRLVRLADERVLLAWPGAAGGRYVIRLAHVALGGVQRPVTIAAAPRGGEALLAGLATGPREDALLLWTQVASPVSDPARAGTMLATYGVLPASARASVGSPERVAAAVAAGAADVAFDPGNDRAVAVWRTADGGIAYAARSPGGAPGAGERG